MTTINSQKLAAEIAAELFTNGVGETADRLVLEFKGTDRGGRCLGNVVDIIEDGIKSLVEGAEKWRALELLLKGKRGDQ